MSKHIEPIINQLNELIASSTQVDEHSHLVIIQGDSLDSNLFQILKTIIQLSSDDFVFEDRDAPYVPNVYLGSDTETDDLDGEERFYLGQCWKIVFSKSILAKYLKARDDEATFLFLSQDSFQTWLKTINPFVQSSSFDPDFSKPVTVRVHGLKVGFGSELLWVLPLDAAAPQVIESGLPDSSEVRGLIHINADKAVNVFPKGFALTWGGIDTDEASRLRYLSVQVLSVCLSQEFKHIDNKCSITLKGAKRLVLTLTDNTEKPTPNFLKNLIEAVRWVYIEKPETRIKLLMDRLSIDIQTDQTFLSGLELFLDDALHQAKDSYDFVILDRKDAYYKELREVMKDMKSQADLFASKIRDLVASLTRDILGVMFALGFTFFGKFDVSHLNQLLVSEHLAMFLHILSGYLILSFILQLSIHLTDATLSESESRKWLAVLRNYTTKSDNKEYFENPILKRKCSLYISLSVAGIIYIMSAFVVWNLQDIVYILSNSVEKFPVKGL